MIKKKVLLISIMFSAFLGGTIALLGFWLFFSPKQTTNNRYQIQPESIFARQDKKIKLPQGINFTESAKNSVGGVVQRRCRIIWFSQELSVF
jgi:hypothetical protein